LEKLREDERYRKDMLIWSGNDDVYYEMMKERTRLAKERAEQERLEEERKQIQREAMGELIMNTLLFIVCIACIIPVGALIWQFAFVR
jgi:phage terminase Nu1 subunit (DNA packaging protein)